MIKILPLPASISRYLACHSNSLLANSSISTSGRQMFNSVVAVNSLTMLLPEILLSVTGAIFTDGSQEMQQGPAYHATLGPQILVIHSTPNSHQCLHAIIIVAIVFLVYFILFIYQYNFICKSRATVEAFSPVDVLLLIYTPHPFFSTSHFRLFLISSMKNTAKLAPGNLFIRGKSHLQQQSSKRSTQMTWARSSLKLRLED